MIVGYAATKGNSSTGIGRDWNEWWILGNALLPYNKFVL